jgi:nicotinamide-nucleotide amidase
MQNKIDDLSVQLGQLLVQHEGMLATAESCTGGLLAGAVTAIAGSSAWFDRGWITYSNDAKRKELNVSAAALKEFGAVSEEVAREMAQGALAQAPRAKLALSTTGIAGPGGGTADKPVGLVCFGFARRTNDGAVQVRSIAKVFEGDRRAVREATVLFSLTTACEWLSQA